MRILQFFKARKELKKFRSTITPGDRVLVKFNRPFHSLVYQVRDTHITVYNESLQFASYPIGCIYPPLN